MSPTRFSLRAAAVAGAVAVLWSVGCATPRPVLYPSGPLEGTDEVTGREAVDECLELAEAHGADTPYVRRAARATFFGATVGGATGAAIGAITSSVGRGAAAGAAGGATAGLVGSLFRSWERDDVERGFVDECLRERGYRPIGWR
jgi:hypothetical protein